MKVGNPCLEAPALQYLRFVAMGVTLFFPWVFIFALPPLQMGIWFNTEGVAFGIAVLGCIAFLLLAIVTQKREIPSYFQISSIHPLLLGVGGLALTSLAMLPVAYHYHLSWFGHPEQMVGGWLWLSVTSVILCHLWLKQQDKDPTCNKAIRISAGLACCAQIAFVVFAHPSYAPGASGQWTLYHFPSHLGWIGVSLLLLSLQESKRISAMLKALAVIAIFLSQNKTAMGGMVSGILLYAVIARYVPPKRQWAILRLILLIAPLLLLAAEYGAFSQEAFPTLSSRFMSWKVLSTDISQSPISHFFTGMGWGQMSDSIIRQLAFLQSIGSQGASWEGIGRFDASSLNQTLDSFAAVGPIGGIFSILIALSPFLLIGKAYFIQEKFVLKDYLDKGLLFAACLMTMLLHHGWFMMLSVFPIFISGVMVLDASNPQHSERVKPLKSLGRIPCFCGGLVAGLFALTLLWTGRSIYSTAIFYSGDLNRSLPVRLARNINGEPLLSCENLVKHQGPGAANLAFWLKAYRSSQSRFSDEDKKDIEGEIKCALQTIYHTTPSPSLVLLEYRKAFLPAG